MNKDSETPNATQFAKLACDVTDAQKAHEQAAHATQLARHRECNALNALNQAQRAFDQAVGQWKKTAPRDSDWKRPA